MKHAELIGRLAEHDALRASIPMQYQPGLAYFSLRNGRLCVSVSFFRVEPSGTGIAFFPARYRAEFLWPFTLIEFCDFSFKENFKDTDFLMPLCVQPAHKDWSNSVENRLRELDAALETLLLTLAPEGGLTAAVIDGYTAELNRLFPRYGELIFPAGGLK